MYICKRNFNFMTMKKNWTIEISQNGWEYIGIVTIRAVLVEKTGAKSVIADGVEIEFDEEISEPY